VKGDPAGKGWFHIDGLQIGDRLLLEQVAGLEWFTDHRDRIAGAWILDIGCAEGLIGMELLALAGDGGALHGLELVESRVKVARDLARGRGFDRATFEVHDAETFSSWYPVRSGARFDVVLALAIAHKLRDPGAFLRAAAAVCEQFLAVRTPAPIITDRRSSFEPFDVPAIMLDAGMKQIAGGHYTRGEWTGIFERER